jgi:anti-sigma factor RsiW
MLNPTNHPGDERLSALVSQEADAVSDATLAQHLSTCARCVTVVDELGALRANLAHLPDLAPSRPLRLVPEVTGGVDRLGSYVRKVFGPVMAAGAALALVGMVGTAAPSFQAATGGSEAAASAAAYDQQRASQRVAAGAEGGPLFSAPDSEIDGSGDSGGEPAEAANEPGGTDEVTQLAAERSPWPMVLFTGIAVLVAGALLRWILVPRAG